VRKGVAAGVLHVDWEWYLTAQILPPVARVCEPIAGTSQQRLATILGLDASRFAVRSAGGRDDDAPFTPKYISSAPDCFAAVDRLLVACPVCRAAAPFAGVYAVSPGAGGLPPTLSSGLVCARPDCAGAHTSFLVPVALPPGVSSAAADAPSRASLPPAPPPGVAADAYAHALLLNAVANKLRSAVLLHQQGLVYCDETVCAYFNHGTRALSTRRGGEACPRPGCRGRVAPDYGHDKLHTQLEYLSQAFDAPREKKRRADDAKAAAEADKKGTAAAAAGYEAVPRAVPELPPAHLARFAEYAKLAKAYLDRSAYHEVRLDSIFDYVNSVNTCVRRALPRLRHPRAPSRACHAVAFLRPCPLARVQQAEDVHRPARGRGQARRQEAAARGRVSALPARSAASGARKTMLLRSGVRV
jgi:hypothetical protein